MYWRVESFFLIGNRFLNIVSATFKHMANRYCRKCASPNKLLIRVGYMFLRYKTKLQSFMHLLCNALTNVKHSLLNLVGQRVG